MLRTAGLVLVVSCAMAACGGKAPPTAENAQSADLVLKNAKIFTVDEAHPWATSVAIREGRIAAVGDDAATVSWVGEKTRVVDLGGKLVVPGFGDTHAHPVMGGLAFSQCPIHAGTSPEEYVKLVEGCVKSQAGATGWLYGVGWKPGIFVPSGAPDKKLLDAIDTDRPLAIRSIGGHSLWLNSAGLKAAGITKATKNPPNGWIERYPNGKPSGTLQEFAMSIVEKQIPPPTLEQSADALRYANHYFLSNGITGWQDASVPISATDLEHVVSAYETLRDKGEIKGHVALALLWENTRGLEQLQDIYAASGKLNGPVLRAKTVKIFVDGVIVPRTAAMLEPYSDAPKVKGDTQLTIDVLNEAVAALDAKGFQVHVHAIGDRAIRVALDAFELARKRNGVKDNRHLISHLNVITKADQPRFVSLGVTANLQPLWSVLDEYMKLTAVRVGPERMKDIYPTGNLMRSGAVVAYGSDWPVASAAPVEGLEVALTRRRPGLADDVPLVEDQGVTLEQAIKAYTYNVAWVNHREDTTGSITTGKNADLVVLDHDLFSIPRTDIAKARVVATLLNGEVVYGELAAAK